MKLRRAAVTGDMRTARHVLRTVIQVAVGIAAAVPTMMTTLHISAALAAKITGGAGLFVIVVAAVQNALEEAGVIKTVLPNPVAATDQSGTPSLPADDSPAVDPAYSPDSGLAPDPAPAPAKKTSARRKRTTT